MTQRDRLTGLTGNSGMKIPVRAASTAALTLAGEQTVDGVALVTGERVLVKDQASSIDNGVYVVDTGAWSRAKDFNGPYDIIQGIMVHVVAGTLHAGTTWEVTSADPLTIGTSAIDFGLVSPSTPLALPITIAQGGTGQTTAAAALGVLGVVQVTAEGGSANAQTGTIPASVTAYAAEQLSSSPRAQRTPARPPSPSPRAGRERSRRRTCSPMAQRSWAANCKSACLWCCNTTARSSISWGKARASRSEARARTTPWSPQMRTTACCTRLQTIIPGPIRSRRTRPCHTRSARC